MTISLEKAIKSAIEFEKKIKEMYAEAIVSAQSLQAKRFFKMLSQDEESHLQYLYAKLKEWSQNGKIQLSNLVSAVPAQDIIQKSLRGSKTQLKIDKQVVVETDMDLLRKIHRAEAETSHFYTALIQQVKEKDRPLFSHFLQIEDGHERYIHNQIDALERNGTWLLPQDE